MTDEDSGAETAKPSSKRIDGILVVDKPVGPTSHDVVREARRLFRTKAVGHVGTLDPFASGVLVLLFGEATKLSPYLTAEDKGYLADVLLGAATDTGDKDGRVVQEAPVLPIPRTVLEAALETERLRTSQVPPQYSAIKVDGVRSYALARRGEAVALPPRPVNVRSIELSSYEHPVVRLALSVAKGYYVRSLAQDLGATLGAPAHLTHLRRTSSGAFTLADCVSWPCSDPTRLMSVASAVRSVLPSATLTDEGVARATHGKILQAPHFGAPPARNEGNELSAWFSPAGQLVAIGRLHPDGYRVARGFSPV